VFLGIDTGGTFTDFVLYDGHLLRVHKVLSTPRAPEDAIIQGIRELGLTGNGLQVVHGSTVATNAVLEGKGVRTVYVTNRGLGDVLTIGRQARLELYNLQPERRAPPVARDLCVEVDVRIAADGRAVRSLDARGRDRLRRELGRLEPQSVAINLLFSFVDDSDERMIESLVPPGVFSSRSSSVLPEYREYERGVATWLNAWVGPLVAGYLERLRTRLSPAPVSVMQSSGGTVSAEHAGGKAVHLLLSGPAGGLTGARFAGGAAGFTRLLTLDMGGTSTDVALIDGDVRLTSEGSIGPYPVAVPMVDMHTIGAGGGSIARVDAGGVLRVGPESAGAEPGPACYGRDGWMPTVTDANLLLGRLRADAFLGGSMRLDIEAARRVMTRLGTELGLSAEGAAEGVIRVANEHMARALRVISVQRGLDPREYVLTTFGGAGGLHVCALAEALGIKHALVPAHAGVLSALGMLVAPRARQLSHTLNGDLAGFDERRIDDALRQLALQGRQSLLAEGVPAEEIAAEYRLDLRYRGQSYTLTVAWEGRDATIAAFHSAHLSRYGHKLDAAVELVNLRCGLRGRPPPVVLEPVASATQRTSRPGRARLYGHEGDVAVWRRSDLYAGQRISGPALVTETVATSYLAPDWECVVDRGGNLVLDRTN
jgi:N-methylhydantoinase A